MIQQTASQSAPAPASHIALNALRLTAGNLSSLINAKHSDAVLMTSWLMQVQFAIKAMEAADV